MLANLERTGTLLGRRRTGLCTIEGTRLHERALRAGVRIEASLVSAACLSAPDERIRRLVADLAAAGVALHVAPDDIVERLTCGRGLGPIVGLARIPPVVPLERALAAGPIHPPVLLAALGITDPGNTGALVRTAHASGAAAFLAVHPTDPFHPRAVRTSMGSVFRIALVREASPDRLLDLLASHGIRTCAAVSSGGTPLPESDFGTASWCILIGCEADGLPADVLRRVELRVSVPMASDIDSLSANAAAAVLLYAVTSRRPACAREGGALG